MIRRGLNGFHSLSRLFFLRFSIREILRLSPALLLLLLLACATQSQTKRLVVIKSDGLPYDVVDRYVRERDPRTGKSQLPWIDYIFYQRGTRLENFYVRGMSLSAPSWSLIDTGQHLQIKGNVEFDRYTMQTYDYLNFIPFYVQATVGKRVDMQGVEVVDSLGIPLLPDAYAHDEKHATFSLFQRGPRYLTFQKALENRFKQGPKELLDEWTMAGLGLSEAFPEQLVRDLLDAINNPQLRYLEVIGTDYDHTAHHNNDRETQLLGLKNLDATLGRVWATIQKTPDADKTTLILVSDHGFNSDARVYSQGFNLVKLLGSPAGGGHHVVTKRRLMMNYSIKTLNPFVPVITTTTRDSYYLKGQSTDYPTVLLDFDGNERASIHLRDSDLNLLHILLQQLQRNSLSTAQRQAVSAQFFKTINARRANWQQEVTDINEELGALRRSIERQRGLCQAQPKKFTKEDQADGKDDDAKRVCAWMDIWIGQDQNYSEYLRTVTNLLSLRQDSFDPAKLKIEDFIDRRAMGDANSVRQLQNYIVGVSPEGLVLKADGSLDMDRSFVHVNYFSLLHSQMVRNNVQPGVANHPIDLVAMRLPAELVKPLVGENDIAPDVVWVTAGDDQQALILARENSQGQLSFRYVPIKNLTQDEAGRLHFEIVPWCPNLPLQIWEDPKLNIPGSKRETWLSEWHSDVEWLHAVHQTRYSNGVIGLYEQLGRHRVGRLRLDEPGLSSDEILLRRFLRKQRNNIEADLLVVANDHWNFDVRWDPLESTCRHASLSIL